MKTKILISAANGIIMNSLIKILKKNFYIVGVDNQPYGNAPNICDEFYLSPKGDDTKFLTFLKKIGKKIDFIFLFVDEEILLINRNINKLGNIRKKIILSESKTLEICLNKLKFHKFCIENQFNTPQLMFNKNMIAKPIYGRGSKNIYRVNTYDDFKIFKKKKNYLVQKYISGKEYTVDCLFRENGELIFALTRMRMVSRGVSIVGKIVKDRAILLKVEEISKKLKFFGPINFQFIKDRYNKIWFLEVNPRLSGSIEFSIRAGFNPFLFYDKNKKFKVNKIKYNKIYKRSFIINDE